MYNIQYNTQIKKDFWSTVMSLYVSHLLTFNDLSFMFSSSKEKHKYVMFVVPYDLCHKVLST